jgi:hypothetical protein
MKELSALILALVVLGAACGGDGPEAAGESVPRVEQTRDSTGSGD